MIVLSEEFPSLAAELRASLTKIGESELAESIDQLQVHGRCACGQRNCGTFYTKRKNEWEGKKLRQVIPVVKRLVAIDVHDDNIVCVEFLDRPDVVAFLDKHIGR